MDLFTLQLIRLLIMLGIVVILLAVGVVCLYYTLMQLPCHTNSTPYNHLKHRCISYSYYQSVCLDLFTLQLIRLLIMLGIVVILLAVGVVCLYYTLMQLPCHTNSTPYNHLKHRCISYSYYQSVCLDLFTLQLIQLSFILKIVLKDNVMLPRGW